jgi:predicted DNA-binding transcriptional regulator YafY
MARRPQSSIEGKYVTLTFTRDECVALMNALRAIESPSDEDAQAFRTIWASNAWA